MEAFLISVLIAATPFLLAGLGELVAERAGVLNLGVEGMMLMGAVAAFAVAFSTGSSAAGMVAGAAAGAALAAVFALVALGLLANQAATGLALTIFGVGASGLIGQGFVGQTIRPLGKFGIPGVSDTTMLGRILLGHDAMVYLALALAAAVAWFLGRTRAGLMLRAVGDNPEGAHALGFHVVRVRVLATLFGGACAGLGGAYLSLAYTPMWGENMTAGRGWIALALVVFATWRPGRLVAGAYLFAAVTQLQFYGQDWGIRLPSQMLAMAPYLATIVALVVISRDVNLTRANAPAAIGRPFRAER
ncbi:ABC transporter permease [Limibaculum sp. FT325]|uniref:ABC transporter permease n=1 Tax=Thermohalobaculum sediminis TaxID=2939436 RepID=UPI0020BECD7B|nr:ABC transporter permease [Limibaculum sediminis]MCL5777395.1 ABC transporter permease [Limibaculum sediminis]